MHREVKSLVHGYITSQRQRWNFPGWGVGQEPGSCSSPQGMLIKITKLLSTGLLEKKNK
jgi:hypothetical protein